MILDQPVLLFVTTFSISADLIRFCFPLVRSTNVVVDDMLESRGFQQSKGPFSLGGTYFLELAVSGGSNSAVPTRETSVPESVTGRVGAG